MKPKPVAVDGWRLVTQVGNRPVNENDDHLDFRGDLHTVIGGAPPHKPGSTGRVYTTLGEFFPSVLDLKWIKP